MIRNFLNSQLSMLRVLVLAFVFFATASTTAQTADDDLTPLTILLNNSATKAENQPVGSNINDLFTLDQGTQFIGSISGIVNCYKGEGIYFGDHVEGGSLTFSLKSAYRHNIARIVVWAKQCYNTDGTPIDVSVKINDSQSVDIVTANQTGLSGYFNIDYFIPAEDCDQITIYSTAKVLIKGIYIVYEGTDAVEGKVESVTIVPTSLKLPPGKVVDLSLKPNIIPTWAKDHSVVWSSSKPTYVSVEDGVVTAIKTGYSDISVTSVNNPSAVAVCRVTVSAVSPTEVTVYPTNETIGVGGALQYTAVVSPEEAIQDVIWSKYPTTTECISVTETGLVNCYKTGSSGFGIKATSTTDNTKSKMVKITVVADLKIEYLEMIQNSMVLYKGDEIQLSADFKPLGASNTQLEWRSLDPSICSIDGNGHVTAISTGSTTIEATTTDGSQLTTSCAITVKPKDNVAGIVTTNEEPLRILTDGGRIRAEGIGQGCDALLFDATGQFVATAKAGSDGCVTFGVPRSAVYILRIGERSFKLAVR